MQNLENYFDYAATTPVLPEIHNQMEPYFSEQFGNPSSVHSFGQEAYAAVEDARDSLRTYFHLPDSSAIFFTGSSTEACNSILFSTIFSAWKRGEKPCHVLISPLEHSAVRETVAFLQKCVFCEAEELAVNSFGQVDPEDVRKKIKPNTALVSVIYGNNEIGTINPIAEISQICAEKGVPFHSDATQYAAHHKLDLRQSNISYLNIAAHKCYGPKGVGALIVQKDELKSFTPLIHGGKQEDGKRAGTHNVPYIVGLSAAYSLLHRDGVLRINKEKADRDLLIQMVLNLIPDSMLTGHPEQRLSNHASFSFKNIDSLILQSVMDQKGFAVSVGSACRSKEIRGQQQLVAIGLGPTWSNGGLRITVGHYTTQAAIQNLVSALAEAVSDIRKTS